MEEYLGRYYVFKTRTKLDTREYILTIEDLVGNKAKFLLELIISGNFGSVGNDWIGFCYLKEDLLNLECIKKTDWNYTFLDEERQDHNLDVSTTFSGIFSKDNQNIRLDLFFEVDKIFLYKVFKDVQDISYRTAREIITSKKLDERVKEYEPFRFWCISNLIYKSIRELDDNNLELIYEYDLEFRLEEKRVVNADEIIKEHHKDKVILDEKNKIVRSESL